MVVHLLWIINKSGQLVYKQVFSSADKLGEIGANSDRNLTLASVLYSLHGMSRQITPVPEDIMDCSGLTMVEGDENCLHCFETPTSVKFVIVTDPANRVDSIFEEIYHAYIDFVMKNPLYTLDETGTGQLIRIPGFTAKIDDIVRRVNEPRK